MRWVEFWPGRWADANKAPMVIAGPDAVTAGTIPPKSVRVAAGPIVTTITLDPSDDDRTLAEAIVRMFAEAPEGVTSLAQAKALAARDTIALRKELDQ